ncbi:3-oxoacyl-[acyl-carrier-protein] synthase III C-terminal domain-containing protein [Nocardia sp. A7]|uniref:3-oxoacyl-[acyl-carrier-protein] synthase III C-terminal domain-containing protein n=1 Tax=Nocardia sp. A7 TaxID=2789274 RepID=UPI00397A3B69
MRVDGRIFIAAATVKVPLSQRVVAAGQDGTSAIATLPPADLGRTAQSLALEAASETLRSAGLTGSDIALLAHASIADGDYDGWTIAPRLARLLGANRAVALSVRQMSNGGAMAAQFAVAQMLTEPRMEHGLVVTADLAAPDVAQWEVDMHAVLADSATAMVLTRTPRALSVRSMVSYGASEEEAWYFERSEHGVISTGPNVFRTRRCVRAAINDACADADIEPDDPRLKVTVLPRLNSSFIVSTFHGLVPTSEVVNLVDDTGHLFAGDLTANVGHLLSERPLAPGDYGLVLNLGVGVTVTAMVVRGESCG